VGALEATCPTLDGFTERLRLSIKLRNDEGLKFCGESFDFATSRCLFVG